MVEHQRSAWHQAAVGLEQKTFMDKWVARVKEGKETKEDELVKAARREAVKLVISAVHWLAATGCPHQQLGRRLVDWVYSARPGPEKPKEGYGE